MSLQEAKQAKENELRETVEAYNALMSKIKEQEAAILKLQGAIDAIEELCQDGAE